MKKLYIAVAVLVTAVFGSCQREKDIKELAPVGENEVALWLRGDAATRAGNNSTQASRGVLIPIGQDQAGTGYYLEETVTDLDATVPATKGTPAYTENIGVLYKDNMFVHVAGGNFTDATYYTMDEDVVDGGGWRYRHVYEQNPWPADGSAVDFYLRMPATMNGVSNMTYPQKGAFAFDYESPVEVEDMTDILFAYRAIDWDLHVTSLPNGVPVLFKHALTGVKFAIGNDLADRTQNGIAIKEIILTGLKDKGKCVVKPTPEDDTYRDTGTHSSAGDVTWSERDITSADAYYSAVFGKTVDGEFVPDAPVDYTSGSFDSKGKYPASFSEGGNMQNLNDADATKTFWFVPQVIEGSVNLTIRYTFGGNDYEWTIDFGQTLKAANVEWKAGQLRTYTIKVDGVNVMIDDNVSPAEHQNTELTKLVNGVEVPVLDKNGNPYKFTAYDGTKEDVTITNTGNTDAFIRAAIIGQWLDSDGNPVFGFTDYANGSYESVESWYQDQFVSKTRRHGEFTNLAGYTAGYSGKWVYNETDKYYYYTEVVKAGQSVPEPLFTKYVVKKTPAVVVAGKVNEVYFVLEIATQAISAKKLDGSFYTYTEAWNHAKAQAQN